MSAETKIDHARPDAQQSRWRCFTGNIVTAFATLTRPPQLHLQHPWLRSPQRLAVAAAAFLVAFFVSAIFVDAAAIRLVKRLPPSVPWFFDQITDFGKSGWFLWPLGVFLLILAALPKLPRIPQLVVAAVSVRAGFLIVAIALPGVFVNIVKHIVGRARPGVGGALDPFLFNPFSWPAAYASLPSGHAATAFSVLVAFGTLWPRTRVILWIYALAIAASRVAVSAHYPSDVLAGAAVGVVGAMMVRRYFALRRLGFSVSPDGAVHAFPEPSLKRIKSVARALSAQ